MKLRFRPTAAVLVLSLICIACGGGGGGGRTPTEPSTPTGKRLQLIVRAVPGNFEGDIFEGAALFDGREVGRANWDRTGGCNFDCNITIDIQGVSPGEHTLRFNVIRQENAAMFYTFILSGTVIDSATGAREQITATSPARVRIRAGEGYTFNLRI